MSQNSATDNTNPGSPVWQNWSQNLFYSSSDQYYFMPHTLQDLQSIIANAAAQSKQIRVSGQRHSQTPLVASSEEPQGKFIIVDLSCYADLGVDGRQRMLISGPNSVTVNTGVREDELDAFLTANKLMLQTVTAGGFFSLGGMTAVDVHGATVQAPIFAETVSAYIIVDANGHVSTIDSSTTKVGLWSPLQFARVSLGALGIVTSVTITVLPRPYANCLTSGTIDNVWQNKADFSNGMAALLASKTRVETFFNPYALTGTSNFTAAWWNVETGSGAAPAPSTTENACQLAQSDKYGAPYLPYGENLAESAAIYAQGFEVPIIATGPAALITSTAISVIKSEVAAAGKNNSDLWLSDAARVIFMSYFIELPDLSAKSLEMVWTALESVSNKVNQHDQFHIAAPMEFRFIRGGNSAMAGTYSAAATSYFVNLDLIAFVAVNSNKNGLDYPAKLLSFFAEVESEWIAMGGWPHNGKMYGFYDPAVGPGIPTQPFNPAFLDSLYNRRKERAEAFDAYRQRCDPSGMFSNQYVTRLIRGS